MSDAVEDPNLIDIAASRYHECRTALSSEKFISLIRDASICFNGADQAEGSVVLVALQPQLWKCTPALGAALKVLIEFYHARCQRHSEGQDTGMLEIAFCIAIICRGKHPPHDTHDVLPQMVREKMPTITDAWTELLETKTEDRFAVLRCWMPFLCPGLLPAAAKQLTSRVLNCAKTIRQRMEHSGITAKALHCKQDEYIADLKNAFRGPFHERRDRYGLSTLDNLNLNLRVNLFLSHYSKVIRREGCSTEYEGLPFYPYIALVQSSGAGKSRLLRELGRTLPLVYGNLNRPGSTGYPLPNKSLREFLLFAHGHDMISVDVNSQICESRYERLLLVTTITFYLLFSHRGDKRKRIVLPDSKALRQPVSDEGWVPVGICEPDSRGGGTEHDLFWDIVTNVTKKTLSDDELGGFLANGGLSLMELETVLQSLGQRMSSPRGQRTSTFRDASEGKQSMVQIESESIGDRNSAKPECREVVDCVFRYILMRTTIGKERLPQIAKSLQTGEPCDVTDAGALHALFVAFDESRCLTQSTVKSSRHMPSDETTEEEVSLFRCLRRVVHEIGRRHGVCIFMLFSDTTAKLANFVPQRYDDPSARLMMGGGFQDVPGQPHAPFLDLRTEKSGTASRAKVYL